MEKSHLIRLSMLALVNVMKAASVPRTTYPAAIDWLNSSRDHVRAHMAEFVRLAEKLGPITENELRLALPPGTRKVVDTM